MIFLWNLEGWGTSCVICWISIVLLCTIIVTIISFIVRQDDKEYRTLRKPNNCYGEIGKNRAVIFHRKFDSEDAKWLALFVRSIMINVA